MDCNNTGIARRLSVKALVKPYGKIGLSLIEDAEIPAIGSQDVLIRVLAASICGSDVHIYRNDPLFRDRVTDGQIIGHEFCGEIVEIGSDVTTVAVGDIISAESHIVCGTCYYCRNGLPHICQEVLGIGIDRPGGFAEYIAIPAENAILKPPSISLDVAAFLEPFGNAVDTARCVDLVGKRVLITGCGPQGLMAIGVAKAAGARQIIATEPVDKRREFARNMLEEHSNPSRRNSDLVLDANDPGILPQIFEATDGLGVDVVLEMSGHPAAIRDGLLALKSGGHVVALGLSSDAMVEVDWNRGLVLKGATFHGIYGRHLYQTWFEAHGLLESGAVNLEPLITHRLPLERFTEGFELLKQGLAAKVILYPNSSGEV
jgi:threonine 3-dehydrogenase